MKIIAILCCIIAWRSAIGADTLDISEIVSKINGCNAIVDESSLDQLVIALTNNNWLCEAPRNLPASAKAWKSKSDNAGLNGNELNDFGICLVHGISVHQDWARAQQCFKESAILGSPLGKHNLETLRIAIGLDPHEEELLEYPFGAATSDSLDGWYFDGTMEDLRNAATQLKWKINRNLFDVDAETDLTILNRYGVCFVCGYYGIEPNYYLAAMCFEKAAVQDPETWDHNNFDLREGEERVLGNRWGIANYRRVLNTPELREYIY
jgi:hypothetical protein